MERDVFAFCAQEVRRCDPDRYRATLFAPEARRKNLFALYAFNLEIARVRERVSEPAAGEARLQWWRDTLDQIFAGRPPRHDVSEALAHAIEAAALPRAPFDALIEARRFDLCDEPMASGQALAAYARTTASGLVGLAAHVLTGETLSPALLDAADAAGRAWALTGILRALPIHARRGQCFLPSDELAARGGDVESLRAGKLTPALSQVIRGVARSARMALGEAREAYRRSGRREALPAFLMLALVPPLLRTLEREGFDPFQDRAELLPLIRLGRLARAGLLGRF